MSKLSSSGNDDPGTEPALVHIILDSCSSNRGEEYHRRLRPLRLSLSGRYEEGSGTASATGNGRAAAGWWLKPILRSQRWGQVKTMPLQRGLVLHIAFRNRQ